MIASLARLEAHHEALITALDSNELSAIQSASQNLHAELGQLRGVDSWAAEPELKLTAERIGRLAEAAMRRVNVLQDHAKRRSAALAALRGHAAPALYTR